MKTEYLNTFKNFRVRTFAVLLLFVMQSVVAAPFVSNSDNTVLDEATGLIWQKCSRGQDLNLFCSVTATAATWAVALTYCNDLTLAGRTWRLPNINELKTVVDRSKPSGATIDISVFPATVTGYYWSSSTYVPYTPYAWSVNFGDGSYYNNNKTTTNYVRCVSTGP